MRQIKPAEHIKPYLAHTKAIEKARIKKQEDRKKRRRSIIWLFGLIAAILLFAFTDQWLNKSSTVIHTDIPQVAPTPTPYPLFECDPYASTITDGKIIKTCNTATPTPKPVLTPKKTSSIDSIKEVIAQKTASMFGPEYVNDMQEIVFRESSFNPQTINKESGACGLAQALPCSKMHCELTDIDCQVNWIISYVYNRYNNPAIALAHENEKGWY